MALIQTKLYDEQVTDLENMADGAKKHQGNSKVKATMKEADFRNRKKRLKTCGRNTTCCLRIRIKLMMNLQKNSMITGFI